MAEYHLPTDHKGKLAVYLDNVSKERRVGKSHNEGGLKVALRINMGNRKRELRILAGKLFRNSHSALGGWHHLQNTDEETDKRGVYVTFEILHR